MAERDESDSDVRIAGEEVAYARGFRAGAMLVVDAVAKTTRATRSDVVRLKHDAEAVVARLEEVAKR